MAETVEFRWHARPLARFAWLMAGISLIGVAMIAGGDAGARVLGALWLGGFLWWARDLWRLQSVRDPVVTASAAGFCDTRVTSAPIPWGAISRVEAFEMEQQSLLGLDFRNPAEALKEARPLVRAMAPVHRLFRIPSVTISMALLDGSREDLVAAIRRFAPEVPIVME